MIRIGLISTIPVVRAGLRMMIEEIASTAQGGEMDAPLLVAEETHLADVDNLVPEIDILLLTDDVVDKVPPHQLQDSGLSQVPLLFLVADTRLAQLPAQLGCKVWGVIMLDSSADELEAALRALVQGMVIYPSNLASAIKTAADTLRLPAGEDELFPSLTGRETDVLQLLSQGLANKQIAMLLQISEHTVKFHISSIYTKFGVTNRMEAVRFGVQQGLVVL